jgi:hypothetical protein
VSLDEQIRAKAKELGLSKAPERASFSVNGSTVPSASDADRDATFGPRAASWARKALAGRAEQLADIPIGDGRNNYLNRSAWVLLRFALAGHLDAQEVIDTLGEADGGGDYPATRNTLESAWNGAHKHGPLDPPVDGTASDDFFELAVRAAKTSPPPESATPPPPMPEPTVDVELRRRMAHERSVAAELALLRARHEAKRVFTAEQAAATFREPPSVATLREELLLPRDPVAFSCDELLPKGGNALLAAAFKAGKTTTVTSYIRAYADGKPFLGRFGVHPHDGRIAIFNYELSRQQFDQWLDDAQIEHPECVAVLHLRGYRLDIRAPSVEDWVVRWLVEHEVSTWIADPLARASVGTDENSNTEMGVWLDTFDVIKQRAGVVDGLVVTHMGRGEQEQGAERARGAARVDDWADVRWILTKDDEGNRYFRASGRDVEVPEEKLTYDPATRHLTIGGGDRKWEKRRQLEDAVVAFVLSNPGCSGRAVELGVEGKGEAVRAALRSATAGHRLRVEDGRNNANLYYANPV